LLYGVPGTEEAAHRIRTQFRRKVLGLSTLTMHRHAVFDNIERAHRAQIAEVRRKDASQQELLELYEADNDRLESENRALLERVARLQTDLANTKAMLEWATRDSDEEVLPDSEVPPKTVDDAVETAKQQHNGLLVFGDDVPVGIRSLAENAGPPDKILAYLGGLARLAQARRNGSLGVSTVQWLKEQGLIAGGESETIKNNRGEMQKRTWHDGHDRREFELHLKPSDATSPDRCARIYFDWDEETRRVVVGWVGRHP
jgi:hypothetical protein